MNYKEIVDNLDTNKVKQLLYDLGANNVIEKDNCLITNTICHNIENGSMKLYYYYNTHTFYCYTSCESMSIFKFLQHYYETRGYEYNWWIDIYEVIKNCSVSINKNEFFTPPYVSIKDGFCKKESYNFKKYSESVLKSFTKFYTPEWLNDGISIKTMEKYEILYSIAQNKIIIPHRDVNGNLIGIRGRALNIDEIEVVGKYAPLHFENKWYSHKLSLNLYGLFQNKENISKTGICYIGEGEKFVMQLESFSTPNCGVAVCGNKFNKFQLDLLLKTCYPREIIICFDNEELLHKNSYFNKLYNLCSQYNKYCNFSFIYDMNNLLKLKESPTDRGELIFNELLRKRIKVK